ncbi:MAG: CoA-binding protein [Candidatus Marinimicrobia bacterium]|nr:CoA-binding protein [Candidatus Neomarinimicrobiota bacterium]
MNDSLVIRKILGMKTIAVVGMSPKTDRPSNYVSMYMKQNGYSIIPVNPGQKEIADLHCYPDLNSIPEQVDVVNIFRRPEYVPPIVNSAIAIGAKAIWMQDHVIHKDAGQKANDAGLLVVMNDCILRQHQQIY